MVMCYGYACVVQILEQCGSIAVYVQAFWKHFVKISRYFLKFWDFLKILRFFKEFEILQGLGIFFLKDLNIFLRFYRFFKDFKDFFKILRFFKDFEEFSQNFLTCVRDLFEWFAPRVAPRGIIVQRQCKQLL